MAEKPLLGNALLSGALVVLEVGEKHVNFTLNGVRVTMLGRNQGEFVSRFAGKRVRCHCDIYCNEYNGKVYPEFISRSVWGE